LAARPDVDVAMVFCTRRLCDVSEQVRGLLARLILTKIGRLAHAQKLLDFLLRFDPTF
jgi:hypothetical protein